MSSVTPFGICVPLAEADAFAARRVNVRGVSIRAAKSLCHVSAPPSFLAAASARENRPSCPAAKPPPRISTFTRTGAGSPATATITSPSSSRPSSEKSTGSRKSANTPRNARAAAGATSAA